MISSYTSGDGVAYQSVPVCVPEGQTDQQGILTVTAMALDAVPVEPSEGGELLPNDVSDVEILPTLNTHPLPRGAQELY